MNAEIGFAGSADFAEERKYIGVIDLDSFELQIYLQRYPQFKGIPSGVADNTGRIVSLSPEAKRLGITREMRKRDALRICPEIHFFEKPERYNKPDSTQTRQASWEITCILRDECQRRNKITVQHVPNDQWYLDMTEYVKRCCNAFLEDDIPYDKNEAGRVGFRFDEYCAPAILQDGGNSYDSWEINRKIGKIERKLRRTEEQVHLYSLAAGGRLLSTLVHLITWKTKFPASAGMAVNLLQAKIACDYNKPGVVTILTESGLENISPSIYITSVPGLKSNLGQLVLDRLGLRFMDELKSVPRDTLLRYFHADDAEKIYRASHGICNQVIQDKLFTNMVNCAKYNLNLSRYEDVQFHLENLSEEMTDRMSEELTRSKRQPTSLQISWTAFLIYNPQRAHKSFSLTFGYDQSLTFIQLAKTCYQIIFYHQNFNIRFMNITSLKISAKHFVNINGGS